MAIDLWPDMNASEWAAWVSALSSVLALGAAVVAGRVAYLLYRNDERRDQRMIDSVLRAQAELVAGWIDESGGEPVVLIRNASNLPIWSALCLYEYAVEPSAATRRTARTIEMIPPSAEPSTFPCPDEVRQALLGGGRCLLTLIFSDASGETWARDHLGKLSERGVASY